MTTKPTFGRRVVAVGLAGAAMVAVGALLLFVGRPAPIERLDLAPTGEARAPASAAPVHVLADEAGMPAGFSRDEHGAASAAVAYATAPQRWLYFTDDEITAAIAEIATPEAVPRLADEVVAEVRTAREQLIESPGRVWWLVRPLAWRVERYSSDRATVAVWTVTVLSAQEVAAPQADWVTVTIDLAWVDGDWQVEVVRDTPGPTPLNGPADLPWDAVPFDETLEGFTRMDGEPLS